MIFCIRIKLRMNIHHVLFFCFLSALQDGNTGLVNAITGFAGAEGGSGSLICSLTSSGSTKFFCKGECKEEDILIKTDDVTAQSGRYSIRYEDGSSGRRTVTVTITQLTKSDSGRYRFGLGGSSVPDDYCDFELIVTDAATLGQNTSFSRAETVGGSVTHGCLNTVYGSRKFFCKNEYKKEEDILVETEENRAQNGRYSIEYREGSVFGLYVTITQLKKSDTGWYRCGYGRASSPDSSYTFSIFVVDVPSASTPRTTQSLISSSGSFTPSSSFPETTEQFTALQDGNTGLVNAIDLFAGAEGGSGSLSCHLTSSGSTKFFCKGECKEEDILIKTDGVTAQSGRYSIRYEDGSSGRRIVTVYITQLTKSDSGRYRYGLGGSSVPDSYCDFDLIVTDAATLDDNTRFIRAGTVGGNTTKGCSNTVYGSRKFFCKDECKKEEDILVETEENRAQNGRYSIEYTQGSAFGLYVTITQLKKSDTGRYRCGYGRASSPDSSNTFSIIVVDAPITSKPNWTLRPFPTSVPSASTPTTTQSLISSSAISEVSRPCDFWPLVVCVPVIVVLLAVVLLLLYKLKKRRNSGLNTRGTSDSRNMELSVSHKNCPPVSMYEDNIYQNLDLD
ncbi:uncharacterized protein LOC121896023 [Thunnus maccoyii]|uniref:uncharacterized protein LOC121896023 n=1 Tax=Thunnus maccoyii TaxID=8240 RepID=UPI001C4D191E|nr:uncharacterized protein LOC121896023 [Thunnus maccoyii]